MLTAERAKKQRGGLISARASLSRLALNDATFLAVDPRRPQGAVAGVSFGEGDAGGAVGAQRRGDVLRVAHGHRLGAQRPLPSKRALAAADGNGHMMRKSAAACDMWRN